MSSFINNVLKLVSGSLLAQMFGIMLYPVIARIYSPADFGVFQLFLSISTIVTIFTCFSYELSIMLPKNDEDSANIVALCIILLTFVSIIVGSIFVLIPEQIGSLLNAPQLSDYLIFVPLVVFLNALFFVLNFWTSRRVRYGVIATARVVNSLSSRVTQIGIGVVRASPIGLISGYCFGYLLADLLMLIKIRSDLHLFNNISLKNIRRLAIRYKRFPIFSMWSQLTNVISLQLTPFMLVYFFSSTVVGYYSMASQLLVLPLTLVGGATSQVFFQKASEVKNISGNLKNILTDVHRRLISIGVFPMMIFMIIGEELFSFFLGSNWYTAGTYAKILAPWIFLRFIYAPISSAFNILEKQNIALGFNFVFVISIFLVLYIGGTYGDPMIALTLLSATAVLLWGAADLYILRMSDVRCIDEIKNLIEYLAIAFAISLPLIVVKYLSLSIYVIFIVAFAVTFAYYLVVMYKDPILRDHLYGTLKTIKNKL
ncbi:Membrane protein involved in the export of O-antigen and teichoic acid [Methanococcoides vulcani]|uniref:Membrane protein involved in the export of O-antigen and teichoic acid n=1 Tax=Methanococcoides vulcani TaxID=1353158 RepID=A0A1H9Z624_9EURY|nr:oligosaccharide flippase family protein [Methanococcoides vulcani]SES77011.1 Membrane protein involved in the export of O-antigen and teichoic acid [Methanococcoides vulcani]